jgi:hypothetical protein
MNWLGWLGAILGVLASVWVLFRYAGSITIRLDARTFKTLYEISKRPGHRKFIISEEFITEAKYPVEFRALCFFEGCPWFYLNHGERLLTAGWHGKDSVTHLTCLRWRAARVKQYLDFKIKEIQMNSLGVPAEVIMPNYTDMIGLIKGTPPQPALDPQLWEDIEKDAAEVFSGKKQKSGALIYGPPGNNKTFFIKYLATKYRVPIKIITFTPDFSNFDVMGIFSQISSRCIVLFEDFDNYFDGRRCILGTENHSIKFTFDQILNGLDGVYNTYENCFFVMTVNDITKVDHALKNRPSRFKFVREFKCPDLQTRMKLLPKQWAESSEGLNLDQIFRLKEFHEQGLSLDEAKSNLGQADRTAEIAKMAHQLYEKRVREGLAGDNEGDWYEAKRILGVT